MEFLVTAAQMKQCDEYTIRRLGLPSMVLMERAALAVTEEMQRERMDLSSVLVVCGSGNNGGDGFAVARLLDEQGVRVTVAFEGKEESMTEETRIQKQICEKCGIKPCSNYQEREYTVIVDALFGVGLSRAVEGRYARIIDWINRQDASCVAVDIPSGVCADDGRVAGVAVMADLTVTFAYRKIGHILYPGAQHCGKVVRRDIGITADGLRSAAAAFTYGEDDLTRITRRVPYSHKGTYGKVLLVAGSRGMCGAAVLAARAACRSGCGLVRVFTHECNRTILQSSIPEAMVTSWENEDELYERLQEAMDWSDVAGIGPGIGRSEGSGALVSYLLQNYDRPLVIDADGLNLLAEQMPLLDETKAEVVLTPHIGEMARLTGRTPGQIQKELCQSAREIAENYGVVCVQKDARTVVTDGSRLYLNTSGNSGMATGGSGDVLTGLVCGLLAQGMSCFESAALGVCIHGLAGDLAASEMGSYGMMAGDLADRIGEIMKKAEGGS
jgi:NAD(P)H-hydrate epimerase